MVGNWSAMYPERPGTALIATAATTNSPAVPAFAANLSMNPLTVVNISPTRATTSTNRITKFATCRSQASVKRARGLK